MYSVVFALKLIGLLHLVQITDTIEHTNNTRIPGQKNSDGCTLPQHPKLGRWKVYSNTAHLTPGEIVPSTTILEISCQEHHNLDGESTTACVRQKWTNRIGQCLRTCPTLKSTPILKATCTRKGVTLESCEEPMEGTAAQFHCGRFYEDKTRQKNPIRLCSNGTWTGSLPVCVPACGKSPRERPTNAIGGRNATMGEYPWAVAIYSANDKELICGGTILNQRMILTAAHCVTDIDGNVQPKENYVVAAGKYFREYNHSGDAKSAQISSIHEIFISRQYKAHLQNYFGDIAVIITNKIFKLSKSVQPVCVNWEPSGYQKMADSIRRRNAYLKVSGWGFTAEYKDPSPVLKHLEVPLVSDKECYKQLPSDFKQYMTDDKLCAGFLNSNTSICKGDSGGGLVARINSRHYIIAVVSVSPLSETNEGGCNSQQYGLYTKFSYYIENFVWEKDAEYTPRVSCSDESGCKTVVSQDPTTRTTTITTRADNATNSSPGDEYCTVPVRLDLVMTIPTRFGMLGYTQARGGMMVPSGTSLIAGCLLPFYHYFGAKEIVCESGRWSSELGRCK